MMNGGRSMVDCKHCGNSMSHHSDVLAEKGFTLVERKDNVIALSDAMRSITKTAS